MADADRRANLDLQIGLMTEREITRGLRMLDQIYRRLGLEGEAGTDLSGARS
jgi:uncharacterized membrane protein